MSFSQIAPDVYALPLGIVNAFLLRDTDGFVLIDAGVPGSDTAILDAIRVLGGQDHDLHHILITHYHADHSGGLAALKRATGADAYMHALDAALVRSGNWSGKRRMQPSPGYEELVARMAANPPPDAEAAVIEHEIGDGDVLPIAGGLTAIAVPGHSAGQLAFFWPRHGGVLFAADAAMNLNGLGYPMVFEDFDAGHASLMKLAALDFHIATFGHGEAITANAARKFRETWLNET